MDRQLTTHELRQGKPVRQDYSSLERHPICILLDNLHSGYNVGAILRIAEALLLEAVYLGGNIPQLSGKHVRKTAVGAEKWIRTERCPSTLDKAVELKQQGVSLIAVELTEKSKDYRDALYTFPAAFVLGSETKGVNDRVLALADQAVHLPIYGMANSLNVSSAASVILYDAVKQIHCRNIFP